MGNSKKQQIEKAIRKGRVDSTLVQALKIKKIRGYSTCQMVRAIGFIDFTTLDRFLSAHAYKNLLREPVLARLEKFVADEAEAKKQAHYILCKALDLNDSEFRAMKELVNKVKKAVADSMEDLVGEGTQQAMNTMFYIREVL